MTSDSSDQPPRSRAPLAFIITVVLLGVAAVGLNAATEAMQLHFKKQPVPPSHPLTSLPSRIGHWVQVSKDKPLDPELEDVLGTDKYLFRDYVDERLVGADKLESFNDKTYREREILLETIRAKNPEAVMNLSLTYYTGKADTVAHIPDRCVIADGYQPTEYETVKWPIGNGKELKTRFIGFEDQTGQRRVLRNIAYFFHVNGRYEDNPESVRATLQKLTEKYGYYMKIEVMSLVPKHDDSAKVMTDFLAAAMPEVEKVLPNWDQVKSGQTAQK